MNCDRILAKRNVFDEKAIAIQNLPKGHKKALNTSTQVASIAVIAEALDEKAVNFYMKYGFEQFRQDPMKLYLPMKSVEELCQTLGI